MTNNYPELQNKIVIISGASSGIGKATALKFAKEGAVVIATSKDKVRGKKIERELKEISPSSTWIQVDIMHKDSIENLFSTISQNFDTIDIAFNNAYDGGGEDKIHKIAYEDWQSTMQGCLTSVFLFMKYELAKMVKAKEGIIVNNSSVDGLRASPSYPAYSSAKHGVLGLTKSAALQYVKEGIRINAICPGWIDTPPVQRYINNNDHIKQEILQHQPIGRIGTPAEVANLVLWLSSSQASFMTGGVIPIDGGYTAV